MQTDFQEILLRQNPWYDFNSNETGDLNVERIAHWIDLSQDDEESNSYANLYMFAYSVNCTQRLK